MATKVLVVDTEAGIQDREVTGYREALLLVRCRTHTLGAVRVPCPDGWLRADDVWSAIAHDRALSAELGRTRLLERLRGEDGAASPALPSWSVVIPTRNRTEHLRHCLTSLTALPHRGEIIVVDNAPADDSTAVLAERFPVRYVREQRPGLNHARAQGARVATGDVVLFADDDVVVDPEWIPQMLLPFRSPRVAAVTGLVMPFELETEAQELFERYGGFGRGFRRRELDLTSIPPAAAGAAGAGANMAFRRELLLRLGLFDADLDCGSVALSGGDTYAFYRLLAAGYVIVYNPDAVVWHRHRRDLESLRRTLYGYSVGGVVVLARCLVEHGDWEALRVGLKWFAHDHLRLLRRSVLRRRGHLPLRLVLAYIAGWFAGPGAYLRGRREERARGLALPSLPGVEERP